jgi:hypothetical protein
MEILGQRKGRPERRRTPRARARRTWDTAMLSRMVTAAAMERMRLSLRKNGGGTKSQYLADGVGRALSIN